MLEKLVHAQDPDLMPALTMARCDAPDELETVTVDIDDLPEDWRGRESWTQACGDDWHEFLSSPLPRRPSAIAPLRGSPDLNVLINHRHADAIRIRIVAAEPFSLDARLL